MTPTEQIAHAALTLTRSAHEAADTIAAETAMDHALVLRLIGEALFAQLNPYALVDGRAARWRCRIRLYDEKFPDEPQADSDPELPADAAGTLIIESLPNVAVELGALASQFHGTPLLRGLQQQELERKQKGLRVTLSRRGGNAVWRVPYDTEQTWSMREGHRPGWLARVDIERVGANNGGTNV